MFLLKLSGIHTNVHNYDRVQGILLPPLFWESSAKGRHGPSSKSNLVQDETLVLQSKIHPRQHSTSPPYSRITEIPLRPPLSPYCPLSHLRLFVNFLYTNSSLSSGTPRPNICLVSICWTFLRASYNLRDVPSNPKFSCGTTNVTGSSRRSVGPSVIISIPRGVDQDLGLRISNCPLSEVSRVSK
ncbi:hypothetical protein K435DRAFT_32739 [Dendrothele bispora CBS 962.96]|uniref:Uncharacterized protein n=1 Tax=Dendrothele bispora (strain CBS 962.96) TaxID=1314807 RepID=A0A4S8KTG1_DENBC|nr:hypothetical protein K435DRAFT_32739 [Dendrothele bispora CBS 962.96]